MILLIGDGIAPPADLVAAHRRRSRNRQSPRCPTMRRTTMFERIDAESRWAGVALVDARLLGSTAAMLGDWDLQSTLLRRAMQEGARAAAAPAKAAASRCWSSAPRSSQDFQRTLFAASRGARPDWASRYILPPVEEFATEQLMETRGSAGVADLGGARADAWRRVLLHPRLARRRAWCCCSLSTPLDLIASRLATLRLRPLAGADAEPARAYGRPRASRLLALGLVGNAPRHAAGARWSRRSAPRPSPRRRGSSGRRCRGRRTVAVFAPQRDLRSRSRSLWRELDGYLVVLLVYAAVSFFIIQHVRHSPAELTRS